jgi:2-methylcitrate dehydratase PrpD
MKSRSMTKMWTGHTTVSWALELSKLLQGLDKKAEEDKALSSATLCALDYFSVVLAGLSEPVSQEIAGTVEMLGGKEMATVFHGGGRTSVPLAALANGTFAHALDFDDTLWTYIGHCTAVIFSSALALAEWLDRDGRQLLSAFARGVEAAHRIGSPTVDRLTKRGWHPTPVVGVFGAAAAATLLMGGGGKQIASALTVATNLASGLRQNFGSKVKPLVSGWSAHSGVLASILARHGISGSEDAFEGRQGYFHAFADSIPDSLLRNEDQELAIVSPGPGFKIYPCCTGTHPAIEAIIMIQKECSLAPSEIESIRIEVTPEVLGELIYPIPSNGRQAKFSLPYCAALALIHGRVELEHFEDHLVKDPDITRVMRLVSVQPNEELFRLGGEHCPAARVTVVTREGKERGKSVHAARGNPGNPVSFQDLERKFHQCAAVAGLPIGRTERFLQQIRDIREIPSIATWMRAEVAPLFRGLVGGGYKNSS